MAKKKKKAKTETKAEAEVMHMFRLEYAFSLPRKRRITPSADGLYFTSDDDLAKELVRCHGVHKISGETAAKIQAARTLGARITGAPAKPALPSLKEVAAAGYENPKAVLDRLKDERDGTSEPKPEPAKATPVKGDEVGDVIDVETSKPSQETDSAAADEGETDGVTAKDIGRMTKAELREFLEDSEVDQPSDDAKLGDLRTAALAALPGTEA